MKVLQVKQYNKQQEIKFHNGYLDYSKGIRSGEPQIAFYLFYTNYGNERQTGYVAFGYHEAGVKRDIAVWGKTKKEAIQKFQK